MPAYSELLNDNLGFHYTVPDLTPGNEIHRQMKNNAC